MKLQRLTTIFILFTAVTSIALWAVMNNAISNLVNESGVKKTTKKKLKIKLGHYEYDGVMASESESKIVGAGLITFYILIIISILSMLLSGLKKMFK